MYSSPSLYGTDRLIKGKSDSSYGSIQEAYTTRDGNLSKQHHDAININDEEYHKIFGSDILKSIIFGGLDGIITTFSIICSSYARHLGLNTIIVLGFANVLADAISMGHGDYFSEKTEHDYIKNQYDRENWEMDNYPEGEINEMVAIYKKDYNIPHQEAVTILDMMSKHKKLFVDHMMVLELGLLPPDNSNNPIKNGVATFCSFIFFGSMPLIVFISYWAIASTITMLGLLGYTRSYFTNTNKTWSCFITILNGSLSASAAYGVSYGLDLLL